MDKTSDEQLENLVALNMYLLGRNQDLLKAYWLMRGKAESLEKDNNSLRLEVKKVRRKADRLFHDLGVWYQAFFDTHDNGRLTLEQYEYIFSKLQRFVAPYVSWWRKHR